MTAVQSVYDRMAFRDAFAATTSVLSRKTVRFA